MSAMDTAETTSERGGTKLFVDGFAYNHKRNGVAHKRWVCVRKHGSICNAAISTLLDNSGPFDATPHNHPADPTAFGVCEAKAQMKTVAKATRTAGRTRAIMADILMNTDDNTRANIGNLNSLLRSVRRHVQGNAPADPAHRRGLEIEEAWKTTGGDNPRPFMIYDNGIGRDNRVVMACCISVDRRYGTSTVISQSFRPFFHNFTSFVHLWVTPLLLVCMPSCQPSRRRCTGSFFKLSAMEVTLC